MAFVIKDNITGNYVGTPNVNPDRMVPIDEARKFTTARKAQNRINWILRGDALYLATFNEPSPAKDLVVVDHCED